MFGLMRFRKTCGQTPETWKSWRLHYCGTCKAMGRVYGQASRLTLNHDTVFLAEVLTALSLQAVAWDSAMRSFHCFSLPATASRVPPALRYAAAATVVLAEYKLRDKTEDSRWRPFWMAARRWWNPRFRKACAELRGFGLDPEQLNAALASQQSIEHRGDTDPALPTATAVSIFYSHGSELVGRPEVRETLGRFGAAFGSLIYWLDAFEDQEGDARTGQFNAVAARGWSRERAIEVVDQHAANALQAMRELRNPGLAAMITSRLRENLDARLGRSVVSGCECAKASQPALAGSWASAWDRAEALADGRAWPVLAVVALCVFVFPVHSRAADSADECMSLSGNLMALSSLFAVAIGKRSKNSSGTSASCCLGGECCCDGAECCYEIGECGECCNCCECGSCCH